LHASFNVNAAFINKIYKSKRRWHVKVRAWRRRSKPRFEVCWATLKEDFSMHPFLFAAIGGTLIGVSVVLLMFLTGRIGGISGIIGGLLPPNLADDWRLRLAFIAGLLLAPLILHAVAGFNGIGAPTVGFAILIPAGFLVGAGSALGNGCTSGHGICGLARLSRRSAVATVAFVAMAAVTVFVMRHVI